MTVLLNSLISCPGPRSSSLNFLFSTRYFFLQHRPRFLLFVSVLFDPPLPGSSALAVSQVSVALGAPVEAAVAVQVVRAGVLAAGAEQELEKRSMGVKEKLVEILFCQLELVETNYVALFFKKKNIILYVFVCLSD